MEPVPFKESNFTLRAPEGEDDCDDLPCFTDGQCFISKWQPTKEEVDRLVNGEGIWIVVWGNLHPMISVTAEKPLKPEIDPELN